MKDKIKKISWKILYLGFIKDNPYGFKNHCDLVERCL